MKIIFFGQSFKRLSFLFLTGHLIFFSVFSSSAFGAIKPNLSDEELLETIQKQTFQFFLRETNPRNGLVPDRASNKFELRVKSPASIAAVGFGLTAYAVGVERGWTDYAYASELARRTLLFFRDQAQHEHGFFYHFLDSEAGRRTRGAEVSPIDTALFLAGALFAAEYYDQPEIKQMAQEIYERVDFEWMLNGGQSLALSWTPERGFNKHRWDHYDESMIMYLLAMASPTHPIPAESWKQISRPAGSYADYHLIQMPPLFTHQYSHIWIDFKDKNDGFADYFKNSVNATLANRQFAIDQQSRYATYDENTWGLTASDGPSGYRAYGAPPGWAQHDGTVAPTACGSSIVFTPKESLACLRNLYENYGDKLWGRYGLSDAFNVDQDWYSDQVLGIDQGPLILMIENYRSGLIWQVMQNASFLKEGMQKAGFKTGSMELSWPDPPLYEIPYTPGGKQIDGYLRDWNGQHEIILDRTHKENGYVENMKDLTGSVRLAWNEDALYFSVKVIDESLILRKSGKSIWMDDAIEIYIDPDGDGFYWNNPKDYQIGMRPHEDKNHVEVWSWFQGGDDPSRSGLIKANGYIHEHGYILEGAIDWNYIGFQPKADKVLNLSVAIHDIDRNRSEAKFQWFMRSAGGYQRFELARAVLKQPEKG